MRLQVHDSTTLRSSGARCPRQSSRSKSSRPQAEFLTRPDTRALSFHALTTYQVLGHDDDDIAVFLTPPKILFSAPSRVAPRVVDEPTVLGSGPPAPAVESGSLPPAVYLSAITTIVSATIAWIIRRDRGRRAAFHDIYRRLETDLKTIPSDPSLDEDLRRDSLRNRCKVAKRRLRALHLLTREVSNATSKCPWDPRGKHARNLRRCAKDISERLVKMERATEEIRVMLEVEELLHFLSGGGRGRDRRDRPRPETDEPSANAVRGAHIDGNSDAGTVNRGAGGFSHLCRQAAKLVLGSRGTTSAQDPCPPHRGEAHQDAPSSEGGRPRLPPTRLATRVKTMLSFDAGDGVPCIFREELERWDEKLSHREQTAVNRLSLGLKRWDLKTVDEALRDLRELGLPDLARDFQPEQERVRNKRWELEEELRVRRKPWTLGLYVDSGFGVDSGFDAGVWGRPSSRLPAGSACPRD